MAYPAFDNRFSSAMAQRQSSLNSEPIRRQYDAMRQQQDAQAAMLRQQEEYYRLLSSGLHQQRSIPPPLPPNHWSTVLCVKPDATILEIKAAYRRLARTAHSDAGGTDAAMSRLNVARDQAMKERSAR